MQEYRMQSTKPKIRVHTRLAAAASAHFTPSAALLPDRPCHTAGGVEDGRRGNGDGAPEDKAANATLGHPPCSSHSPATHSALPAPPGKQSRRRFGSQPPAKRAARKPPAAPPTAARNLEGGGRGGGLRMHSRLSRATAASCWSCRVAWRYRQQRPPQSRMVRPPRTVRRSADSAAGSESI